MLDKNMNGDVSAVVQYVKTAEYARERLSVLHEENVMRLPKTSRAKDNVRRVFDYLEQHPIMDIGRTADALDLSFNTVSTVVRKMVG